MIIQILSLRGFGIDALVILESYLHNRSQSVRIKGIISTLLSSRTGVPQASILGPILFNIRTSGFTSFVDQCNIHVYADGVQLFYSFSYSDYLTVEAVIDDNFQKVVEISNKHCLILNPSKTTLIMLIC